MGSPAQSRDERLDLLRGLALLIIFITHIPGLVFAGLTPRAFGYADAAEAFVLLAGLSAYFAYARVMLAAGPLDATTVARGALPILTRVWQLYITHIALVLVIAGILAYAAQRFGDPDYIESAGLDVLLTAPADAVRAIVTLTFLPYFLDILPLYIVLLTAMPLMVLAIRIHWAVPLVISAALYGLAQARGINLPNINASSVWYFNPFAWQVLFVLGLVVSHLKTTGRLEALFAARRLVAAITAVAAAYVAFTFVAAEPWRQIAMFANVEIIDPAMLPLADKTNLTPLRLVDALAKFWLLAVLIRPGAGWLMTPASRLLVLAGRHSLPIFVLGLILSTIATVIIKEAGYEMWAQVAVVIGGATVMLVFARLLDWQAAISRKDPRATIPRAPSISPGQPLAPVLGGAIAPAQGSRQVSATLPIKLTDAPSSIEVGSIPSTKSGGVA